MKPSEKLKQIKKQVESSLDTNKDFDFLLKEIPELIEKRTRLGKGVTESGALKKLDPLSDSYVEQRKKIKLGEGATPKRSNLTKTGQMLSSIFGIRKGTVFSFFFKDSRDDGKKNSDIAKYAAEKGRRFFDLSESERAGLSRKIAKVIKESIKKLFDK